LAALRTCLLAEETCLTALDALGREGVETRVLKGIASARLDYADPSHRVFGDADLLIEPCDLERAIGALVRAGFERSEPPVRGWWERRFGKSVVLHGANGGELDLHLRLAAGFFGERIRRETYWTQPARFALGDGTAAALDPLGRLLNACTHAVLGGGSGLRARRDVAQLILVTGADWAELADRAAHGGFDVVIARAIEAVWSELELPGDHPAAVWAEQSVSEPVQAGAIAASGAVGDGWSAEGFGALPAYHRLDRVRFLAGLAMPSRASLAARGRSRGSHLRESMRSWNGRSRRQ
jgi:hypothetical protein